jgi:ABC-type nitrate/sulfonate/bicarbonate transport system substrate-binding protein
MKPTKHPENTMRRRLLQGIASAAAGAALPFHAHAQAQTVKVGHLGIVADGPYYVAIEKGYFREQGVNVVLERFNSAAQAIAPLSTNDIQIGGGALSAALFNAFARDWPVRIIMSRTSDRPNYSSDTLIVRSDLKDSVKSIADLRGKKIAVNAPAGGLMYMLGKMLESAGLTIKDVNVVYMPWPNMGAAFETKAIDAGAVVEPFVELYNSRQLAFPFRRAADVMRDPPFEVSVIMANMNWARQNPDLAKAFAVAYLKGARDYHTAMKGGRNRDEVVQIMSRYTSMKEVALYDKIQWEHVDPNGRFSIESVRDQQEWHARQGSIPTKVKVEDMIDNSFLQHAIQKLGTAQ